MRTVAQIPVGQISELLGYTPAKNEVFSITINPLWNAENDKVQTESVNLFGAHNSEGKVILVDNFTEAQSLLTS